MTAPGKLRRRLVLEAPVETPDGAGGVARGYQDAATLWASVVPLAARHEADAAQAGATATHRIVVRSGPAITTRHRLRDGARLYRIVTVRDADPARRYLDILVEERTA